MEWSKNIAIHFIEELKRRPILWNAYHEDYRKKNKRKIKVNELATIFHVKAELIKDKIANLRRQFNREHIKVMESVKGEAGFSEVYVPKWYGYKLLLFLAIGTEWEARRITFVNQPTPDISFDDIPKDGLTGADDRGSSEYSQNEEETAVTASPEQFLAEANDREPTPAPVAQTPPKPESYQLRHNNHLTIVLEALARDEAFMDVTLTAQGRSLKAHKSVLSAVSPYFRGVLRENPCQHPIIIMPRDVRFEELFSIVNYIYKGEMTVAAEDLTSLLKTAEILQVSGLAPSDSTATVNPHIGNFRSSSASSSSSSNLPSVPKAAKTVKETNQGISTPVARPKSPDGMINPSDFMDMDMTYVKEEVHSGGEEDEDTVTSETSAQPPENTSPKTNEMPQPEPITFSSIYNPNQEQTPTSNSSPQDFDSSTKPESETDATSNMDSTKSNNTENPQPFICPYCQDQHRGVENMTTHLRLNHPTKPGFTCGCGRVFIRHMTHQAHVKVCSSSS